MNDTIKGQLERLSNFKHAVDGVDMDGYPQDFNEVVFYANTTSDNTPKIKVVFADYVINPFDGFDMNDRFNNGVPPYSKTMFGEIVRETPKMYLLKVFTPNTGKEWVGWCYKKCCEIYTL